MRSALALARQLDTPAQPLPLLPNPEAEQLMVAPYWGPECISTSEETNLMGAASLLAAAWVITGGRAQHRGCLALLQASGMTATAGRRLLEQTRLTLAEPSHAAVVAVLRARLESGIAAGL
jgi:hypothetical protein